LEHLDLVGGEELAVELSAQPAEWGRREGIPRVNDDGFVPAPVVSQGQRSFRGEQTVSFDGLDSGSPIYSTLDGSPPTNRSTLYNGPFSILESTTLRAIAVEGRASAETRAEFILRPNDWTISLDAEYAPQYSAGGPEALIDGLRGDEEWRKGDWQGFYDQDVVVTIDLGEIQSITNIYASFLQDTRPWIIFPREVIFEVSQDGEVFDEFLREAAPRPPDSLEATMSVYGGGIGDVLVLARYIRMRAVTYGSLPNWHLGAGNPSWIFGDEGWAE